LDAIHKVGLNRALIRDVLTDLKTFQGYQGVTGEIILDGSWNDVGKIFYGRDQGRGLSFHPCHLGDGIVKKGY
jgi:hypothetical protein